jgi:hypothetical protein
MKIDAIEVRGEKQYPYQSVTHVCSDDKITIGGAIEVRVGVSGVDATMRDIELSRDFIIFTQGKTLVIKLGPVRGVANLMRLAAEVLETRENE